ncbi:phosphotransferase enzyme family protein [Nocardioides sp.]|uniref:phosphotransferase enzyme family protein n=1 Tax=Nocardioides sp. TaxID=35761 RepID=UPI002ED0F5EE
MLTIDELVRFAETLDPEERHSPVADAAAEEWGLDRPLFVRSSASHVFVAPRREEDDQGRQRGRVVLRLRPDTEPHREVLERGARAAASWYGAGAPVANAVASSSGRFTHSVEGYVVQALAAVEGEILEGRADLAQHAAAWGEALARLHLHGHGIVDAPDAVDLLSLEAHGTADDDVATLAVLLGRRLAELPRTSEVFGVLHGDPEADNAVLLDDGVVLVDPDDVRRGWFVSDVAFALRDWATVSGGVDLDAEVPGRFLEGYHRVRSLSDEEIGWLPLMAQASAVEDLLAFQAHLEVQPQPDWPDWAVDLDHRVRARAAALRAELSV